MLTALLLSFIAGFADIFGGFLSVAKKVSQKVLGYFIAVSAGFILAVTFLDIYPEVIKELSFGPLLILIGFILIFTSENLFAVHAHDGEGEHDHTLFGEQCCDDDESLLKRHSVVAAFLGLLIHTFFDGAAIAARLLVSPIGGILVFLAVLSHKVPEGFAMASIFQAGGSKRFRAFLAASSLGLATVVGAAAVYLSGSQEFSLIFLGLAAGSFTYITTSELIPFISGTKDRKGIVFFLLGVALFYLTSELLSALGL
jgi:zinc transporter ZupT